MKTTGSHPSATFHAPVDAAAAAFAVLDRRGTVIAWSPTAEEYLGYHAHEVLGRSAEVLRDSDASVPGAFLKDVTGTRALRRRDGGSLRAVVQARPLTFPDDRAAWLVMFVPAERLERQATDQAMLRGLFRQSPIALTVFDADGRVTWVNDAVQSEFGLPPEAWIGRYVRDVMPQGELLSPTGHGTLEDLIRQVHRTGEPLVDLRYRSPVPTGAGRTRVWSASYFRLEDDQGNALGVCESAFAVTDRYEALQRLALLSRASRIGTGLDAVRTAEELAEVAVPDFADEVTVELTATVFAHEEDDIPAEPLREAARRAVPGYDASMSHATPHPPWRITLALSTEGGELGRTTFVRAPTRGPFTDEDRSLASELVTHAAVCVDNARRYARERAAALTLQRELLPQRLIVPTGVEVAHHYAPAGGPRGVGGDWFDVIPLSGARVGLVVGDVPGHGLRAAATMGRLRTTVRALAALDLPPDEVLSRLDDLVTQARIGIHPVPGDGPEDAASGATCLYAVYDPTSRNCVMASAGHLTPVRVTPEGTAAPLELPVGPPLGTGGLPHEYAEYELAPGSTLAMFTDGLVATEYDDLAAGVTELGRILARREAAPPDVCRRVADRFLHRPGHDDATLLVVRVDGLPDSQMASWPIPPEPAQVATARELTTHRLAEWGLGEVGFAAELVVSELVTNAIRYGGPPVNLRLLWDRQRKLICEVTDGGHTSPHLRRADLDDEGGRGLFLVAQLTDRWGTRSSRQGKTIWAEIPLGEQPL
ncbi:SpoIIE family protein phosphatase [Streptomyces phaeochromogenes]